MKYKNDQRVVMTLDAGGTNFRFVGMRGGRPVTEVVAFPSNGEDLQRCLSNLVEGFTRVRSLCPEPPVAISFAFPGPADYPNGTIGDLGNLPSFRGGVALGPMLQRKFGLPVFINNDGDLFVYGEAIGGFLPHVNQLLENSGSSKRFQNLFGVTLGTGFGGGVVRKGEMFAGDNSMAGEIWLLRNRLDPAINAEEGACIRAVRRVYAEVAGIDFEDAPEPRVICKIAKGDMPGNRSAAEEAFRRLGVVIGDAIGNALTLVDGLVVVGGGLSGAWDQFSPSLMDELRTPYVSPTGRTWMRTAARVFNLEDPMEMEFFVKGETRSIMVPDSPDTVEYDPLQRIGLGLSRLGTREAVALGAYVYAVDRLRA